MHEWLDIRLQLIPANHLYRNKRKSMARYQMIQQIQQMLCLQQGDNRDCHGCFNGATVAKVIS